jgi:zinc protease
MGACVRIRTLDLRVVWAVFIAGLIVPAPARAGVEPSPEPYTVPVFHSKLSNGLQVVVSEDRSSPIVTVEVMYKIGFRIEPKGRTGFAHLFEHMMFQGSANVGKFEHVAIMQANGGVVNGSTRFDYTNYFQSVPSNALELTLWLEADRMRSLNVTPENLKNQQNVVSEEVRVNVLNQPYGGLEWLRLPQKANTNWYNAHNFYGDLTDLEAATIEDVRNFFDTYYSPSNAVLVVVGDAGPDEVMRLAERHFGGIPARTVPPLPDISEPRQTDEKTFTETDPLARTPAVAIGYHLPERMTKPFYALSVLDPLLVGDESALLYQKLVKEKRLATSVYGGVNLLGSNFDVLGPMLYTIRVDYLNERSGRDVLAAVDEVVGRIQEQGITEDELKRAKVAFRSAFYELLGGGSLPGFGRANLLAAFALFDGDPSRINTILADLEKVTTADVQAAAREYLRPTNRTSIDRVPAQNPGESR